MSDEQTAQPATESSPQTKITACRPPASEIQVLGGALASVGAVGAIVGGLTGYWNAWKVVSTDLLHSAAPQPSKPARVAVSGGPTVAVFPFENRTGDAAHDSFADDLTRGMIANLVRRTTSSRASGDRCPHGPRSGEERTLAVRSAPTTSSTATCARAATEHGS
jgi:hypothetical protein